MSDLTYKQLTKAVSDLTTEILKTADAVQSHAAHLDDEAQDTTHVAESIGAMRVDQATVAETRELARIMKGLSEQAITYASTAHTAARTAAAAGREAEASHGALYEAVNRSLIGAEAYDLDREWLRQE